MEKTSEIEWLMQGDISIAWQTARDLLGEDRPDLRSRIATEGWGKQFLDARWRYNILRCLDYFREANCPYDPATNDALEALLAQRRQDGRWPRSKKLPGKVFFPMEPPRQPSRWNTLLALRVFEAYPQTT